MLDASVQEDDVLSAGGSAGNMRDEYESRSSNDNLNDAAATLSESGESDALSMSFRSIDFNSSRRGSIEVQFLHEDAARLEEKRKNKA